MPLEWNFHYSRCLIEDGLPNRVVGQDFAWDIQFWTSKTLHKVKEQGKTAVPVSDYKYQVRAQILAVANKACVVDFGLKAIADAGIIPDDCKSGDYLAGEIGLSLSDGHYEIPPGVSLESLRRKWHVNAIRADVTPYISGPSNPNFSYRDESRIEYQPVWSTAAVRAASYILHCCETL